MLSNTLGRYIVILSIIALTVFSFPVITKDSTPFITALVGLWLFASYLTIKPIADWFKFKSFLKDKPKPSPPNFKEITVKKDFFNLKVHSNANTVDVFDESDLKATFYLKDKIQRRRQKINYSETKAIITRIFEVDSFSLLGAESHLRTYGAKFYILNDKHKTKYLFTSYCKFNETTAKHTEKTLYRKEDFFKLLKNYSKELANITNLPLIIYENK